MKWLLIMYASTYGFMSTPAMQVFDTEEQCLYVGRHIEQKHGSYRDIECIQLNDKEGKDAPKSK